MSYKWKLLAILVSSRTILFGKVTGISGILSDTITYNQVKDYDRFKATMFIGGILCGGAIAKVYLPACFEDWSTLPVQRLVIAGVLVGFGTKTANGCTSGHGVCGISNFRLRSLAATMAFMLAGFVTAMAADTSSFLPKFSNTLPQERAGAVVGVMIAVCIVIVIVSALFKDSSLVTNGYGNVIISGIFDCIFGITFALAMAVSNMSKLSATISFLDLRYWNPALAFIMGGAICINAPLQYLIANKGPSKPFLGVEFSCPKLKEVDIKLIGGSIIFGVGWGLCGACPGPAITNVTSGNIYPLIYIASLVLGQYLQIYFNTSIDNLLSSKGTNSGIPTKLDSDNVATNESTIVANPNPY